MTKLADDNDKINTRILKVFRNTKRIFKTGSDARDRLLTISEYQALLSKSPYHLQGILITAYNTGMRPEEIYGLKWPYIDWEKNFVRLPAEATKEKNPKISP